MHIELNNSSPSLTVNDLFFDPLDRVFPDLINRHPCPEFPDEDWLRAGVLRSLEDVPSGRGFLQEHGPRLKNPPKVSNYFESLKSPRRGCLARRKWMRDEREKTHLAITDTRAPIAADMLRGTERASWEVI